jgi:hypothetical protein
MEQPFLVIIPSKNEKTGHNTPNKHRKTLKGRKKAADSLRILRLEEGYDNSLSFLIVSHISQIG